MTETNKKILELIKENKSFREISSIIGISEKQLYIRIKQIINYGYLLEPSYFYNSDLCYNLVKEKQHRNTSSVDIIMPKNENVFRCLVISDLHIGSVDSDIKLVDAVYEYAIKNGINIILNCGDIFDGDYTADSRFLKSLDSQLEYFIEKYPYDKGINNFVISGNHDYHSLHYDNLDVLKHINYKRHDIIPIGHGQGNVNVKNDSIILFHKLRDGFKPIINNERIVLSGHSHMMKTKLKDIFWLGVPTLSNKSNDKTKDVIPGFIDLSINLENKRFEYVEAKHLIITPNIVQVSEVRGKVKTLFKNKY